MNNTYLSVKDVAALLPGGVHPYTVGLWIKKGLNGVKLQAIKPGKSYLILREWFDAFLAKADAAKSSGGKKAAAVAVRSKSRRTAARKKLVKKGVKVKA